MKKILMLIVIVSAAMPSFSQTKIFTLKSKDQVTAFNSLLENIKAAQDEYQILLDQFSQTHQAFMNYYEPYKKFQDSSVVYLRAEKAIFDSLDKIKHDESYFAVVARIKSFEGKERPALKKRLATLDSLNRESDRITTLLSSNADYQIKIRSAILDLFGMPSTILDAGKQKFTLSVQYHHKEICLIEM